MEKGPVMLMILDGFGINEKTDGNAVKLAKTPNIDKLMKKYPNTIMYTSGLKVGLPDGQMGNSEVGHTNIGAGRIVYQELTKITKSIEDGDFFAIPEFIEAIENCKKHNSKLHILGLLSDGGVHSHIRHLYGLLEMAKRRDFEDVYVHCFLDGRDTPPASAEGYITQLEEKMKEKKVGIIFGNFSNLSQISKHEIDLSRLKELVENGNRIAFTNTCKGASEGREVFIWSAIEVYRAGIDAEDVVKMMTIQPAEMLGVADQIGSIEVGKDADITIYSDHPVKSYAAHVQFCMINGMVVLS